MMIPAMTTRLQLPLLTAGQAQKEVTHNEALIRLDSLLFPHCVTAGENAPPQGPGVGESWLVGPSPVGVWQGKANYLAIWTEGGWRFVDLPQGARISVGKARQLRVREAAGWASLDGLTSPKGGDVIDRHCRDTVESMLRILARMGWNVAI